MSVVKGWAHFVVSNWNFVCAKGLCFNLSTICIYFSIRAFLLESCVADICARAYNHRYAHVLAYTQARLPALFLTTARTNSLCRQILICRRFVISNSNFFTYLIYYFYNSLIATIIFTNLYICSLSFNLPHVSLCNARGCYCKGHSMQAGAWFRTHNFFV